MPSAETPLRTLLVALAVSLVCAGFVSTAAVLLQPKLRERRDEERRAHVAALVERLPGVEALLESGGTPDVETLVVDLATGRADPTIDPATFDARAAALDPELGVALSPEQDPARLGRRARAAAVHLVRREGRVALVVLPVHGSGYGGRMEGFVALEGDANTVAALSFTEHRETPGIGSRIDDAAWRARWVGKRVLDDEGNLRIGVGPGRVEPAAAAYRVDAISGATVTSEAVDRLVRFWLGEHGFGPLLERLRAGETP